MLIRHPRPLPGRQAMFDVEFVDGVAHVASLHPEREIALRQHGCVIEEPTDDLEALTAAGLRDLAARRGLALPVTARSKRAIIAHLTGAA